MIKFIVKIWAKLMLKGRKSCWNLQINIYIILSEYFTLLLYIQLYDYYEYTVLFIINIQIFEDIITYILYTHNTILHLH